MEEPKLSLSSEDSEDSGCPSENDGCHMGLTLERLCEVGALCFSSRSHRCSLGSRLMTVVL